MGLPPCSIPSTTGAPAKSTRAKKPTKTEDGTKCRAGKMPALHDCWRLWRVLGLGDDFDSGADGSEVVELDHVGVA